MERVDALTVGALIGVLPAEVEGIGFYDVGGEPVSSAVQRPERRAPHVRLKQLDRYLDEARAGVPDAELARVAGCTAAQVRRWRIARGIQRRRGRPTTCARATAAATAFYGREFVPVLSRVEASVVHGAFTPPEYLVREPLRYDALVRCVVAARDAGLTTQDLVAGLGVRCCDIEHADKIGRRR